MSLNTHDLVEQIQRQLRETLATAKRASADARDAARTMATAKEKSEDARAAQEFGSLASGQQRQTKKAAQDLKALESFGKRGWPAYDATTPVGLGAIVDVISEDDEGEYGRTFVVLPAGAGSELAGPGGDGIIQVITPGSPVGRALMGRRTGDTIDVTIAGEIREWTVLEVC